jgi:hypothetical protein
MAQVVLIVVFVLLLANHCVLLMRKNKLQEERI